MHVMNMDLQWFLQGQDALNISISYNCPSLKSNKFFSLKIKNINNNHVVSQFTFLIPNIVLTIDS